MTKTILASLLVAAAFTGCANWQPNPDAALMFYNATQQYSRPAYLHVQPVQQAPRSQVQQDTWTPIRLDPQRGTQYCNQQGLCLWK